MRSQSERIPIATGERAPLPLRRILLPSGEDPREMRYSALYKTLVPLGLGITATMGKHGLIAAYEGEVKRRAAAISRASNPDFPGTVSHFIPRAIAELGGKR